MAENRKQLLHIRSNQPNTEGNGPKLPTSEQIEYGEIAINYLKDNETISIKNSADEIVTFKSNKVLEKTLNDHVSNYDNPHQVTKGQIGLGNVNNTSDLEKPLSNAATTELNKKINSGDVVDNLTTNDSTKPLSANQGKVLKVMIDGIGGGQAGDISDLLARVSALEEELEKGIAMADIVIADSL